MSPVACIGHSRGDSMVAQLRIFWCKAPTKVGINVNAPRPGAGSSSRGLTQFRDRFGEPVQAFAGAVWSDQIIVADPGQHAATDIGRMHHDIHVSFDAHWLVLPNERPLHQIVALAMAM